ncbi:SpoIIE family protein phosphatase [candidate division CSSED10-310 bacterium]|uniref:SpoIIE family protein phosphatase n=1 Tax=candidate division CSSED10-310 bacterium TaxID=2855610 RepID=A0ABV6Z2V4_UNCC1
MQCSKCHKSMNEQIIRLKEGVLKYFICNHCLLIWLDRTASKMLDIDQFHKEKEHPSDYACPICKNIVLETLKFSPKLAVEVMQCRKCTGMQLPFLKRELKSSDDASLSDLEEFLNSVYRSYKHEQEFKKVNQLPTSFHIAQAVDTEYQCPQCDIELTQYTVYDKDINTPAVFEICDTCYGIWLDADDLVNRKHSGQATPMAVDYESVVPSRRTCPKCGDTKLIAMKFKGLETIIDCCSACYGTWLDGGELHEFCEYFGANNQDVIDALVDNAIFQQPALCKMLKTFSQTLHDLDSQLAEQEKNLEQARDIQMKLLFKNEIPKSVMSHHYGSYEIASFWHPAKTVGGDYFDLVHFNLEGTDYMGICMADVSGKGLPAALLMVNLQALLNSFAPLTLSAGELCSQLNSIFYYNSSANKFITMVYGILNTSTNEFTYTNAGHNPPILLTENETIWLRDGGTVLGLFPESDYAQTTITLAKNDRILLYTDGVSETTNPEGEEFEEERLAEVFNELRGQPVIDTHKRIVRTIKEFNQGNYNDDTTLLLLERIS